MISNVYFPRVSGANLERRTFKLPDDFAGDLNVVLVAYERWQQALIDSWTPELGPLAAAHAGLRIYETPVIQFAMRFMRAWLDAGMRSGIPDPAVRATTITLYTNISAFNRALGLPDTSTAYVLLVDRRGQVLWRGQGQCDPQQLAGLRAALQTAASTR